MGMSPEAFAQQLAQGDGLSAIMIDALRSKALAFLLRQVKVVDTAGSEVVPPDQAAPIVPPGEDIEDVDPDVDAATDTDAEDAGGSTDPAPSG